MKRIKINCEKIYTLNKESKDKKFHFYLEKLLLNYMTNNSYILKAKFKNIYEHKSITDLVCKTRS
jgi:hypothetical protein